MSQKHYVYNALKSGAVGQLQDPARQREALPVACRGPAFTHREEVSRSAIALTNSAKALEDIGGMQARTG